MLPLWKLKREIVRLGWNLTRLPRRLFERLTFRPYYDLILSKAIRTRAGTLPFGSEIGIYLIFPKSGLLPSHLRTLQMMIDAGITPFIVSNLPLNDTDYATLDPLCTAVMERPNQGYDFGGYRDAILHLGDNLRHLKRLWILNDSVWMLPTEQSWFDAARLHGTDFTAATSTYATPRVDPVDFREILDQPWQVSFTHRYVHYASYALSIGPRILNHPGFIRYWRRLAISNDKTITVRRGEMGLTRWILQHGFSHSATCEIDRLPEELDALSDTALDALTRELILPEGLRPPHLHEVRETVLARNPKTTGGRQDRIAFILTAASRAATAYALPAYTISHRSFQFLKKSPLSGSPEMVRNMHAILNHIPGPTGEEIRHEASFYSPAPHATAPRTIAQGETP